MDHLAIVLGGACGLLRHLVVAPYSVTGSLLAAALAVALNVHADIAGKVVAVADGDTLTVLHDRVQVKVRFTEIDAPESKQAFGQRSKQSLSDLCFGKTALLADGGKDRYGRTLARVTCAGIDANAAQVRRDMAWTFTKYLTDPAIKVLETEARNAKRGLWVDTEPVPPWEWRSVSPLMKGWSAQIKCKEWTDSG